MRPARQVAFIEERGAEFMVDVSHEREALSQLALKSQQIIEDVQSRADNRMIPIDRVGVNDIQYPIRVLDRDGKPQHTVANLSMSVDLPHDVKGTHMSRFIEILNAYDDELGIDTLPNILSTIRERLGAASARIEADFPFFLNRAAPVSGAKSLMNYECSLLGESGTKKGDYVLTVKVPVTSLCPCSKEISDYGAHNQRGFLTIKARSKLTIDGSLPRISMEDIIDVAEQSASSPVYPLLKRPDERHVTMQAYENPVFVEDMVREVATKLKIDDRLSWFSVHAENQESIHNHNAFAQIEWARA